ncbi:MAG: TetR family transcriptional regulator [Acetobacteraceae bacterium]|nr:TetR family transcriptional regulator [Acetobacteraceae bacterium]
MDDDEFDRAAIAAVFEQAALRGWRDVSLVEAGQDAGLDLARLRRRFPSRGAVLMRFGAEVDGAALAGVPDGTPRERLFDILMNRFEALQRHREGVRALLSALPTDPAASTLLYAGTMRSMKWLLEGAGVPATGLSGALRVQGLFAVWLYALRAWEKDDSPDLSGTMAAVDRGLDRVMQAERSLPGRAPDPMDPIVEPEPAAEPDPPAMIGDDPAAASGVIGPAG